MSSIGRIAKTGGLTALLGGLGWLNWTLATTPVETSPIMPTPETTPPVAEPTSMASDSGKRVTLSELSETLDRPLFNETRRPIVASPPNPPERVADTERETPGDSEDEPSRLTLVGLMGTGRDQRQALIRAQGKAYGSWIGVGSEIEGWRLARIEDDHVVVERNGAEEELAIRSTHAE